MSSDFCTCGCTHLCVHTHTPVHTWHIKYTNYINDIGEDTLMHGLLCRGKEVQAVQGP